MFGHRRRDTLEWMDSLPMSVGARAGQHEELGGLSFNHFLNELALHDLGHIRQVIELYRSNAFYPNMDRFKRYYKIHP